MKNPEKNQKPGKAGISLLCAISFFPLFLLCSLSAIAQKEWMDQAGEPVLSYGDPGTWDDAVVWNPAVINDRDTFKMWYTGHDESIWTVSTTGRIGYAWSLDGIDWNKYEDNPVIQPEFDWEGGKINGCAVIKDGDTLRMWYGAAWIWSTTDNVTSPAKKVGYATSLDGINWTKYPDPVLEPGPESDWDSDFLVPQTVIKEDNEYKMWYYAGKYGFPFEEAMPQTGLATSPDGILWTKYNDTTTASAPYQYSDPVLKVGDTYEWDSHRITEPMVLHTGSRYEMWYVGLTAPINADTKSEIGYATSEDGIHWSKYPDNPVIPDYSFNWGNSIGGGSVLKNYEGYHLWFSCFHTPPTHAKPQIGYAFSIIDGTALIQSPDILSVYPNPTCSSITIKSSFPDQYTIEIISLSGQLIYSEELEGANKQIDISSFSKGVYFVTVRGKGFVRTEKVVKW